MIRVGANNLRGVEKTISSLKGKFQSYSSKIKLPQPLFDKIFPNTFLSSEYYLIFPTLFAKAFKQKNKTFIDDLCLAGYIYFKYLICMDSLHDNDVEDHENNVDAKILLLRSHVFHQEALKILGNYFGQNNLFWKLWSKRNNEFLEGLLIDSKYSPEFTLDIFKKLYMNKCSFLKTTVDAYYSKHTSSSKLYVALTRSFDHLAIGRCIQDDLEDFKKDLLFKKNNLGHTLLNKWFLDQGKTMQDHSPATLEKYVYISKVADTMLVLSKKYFTLAIADVKDFKRSLPLYIKHLEAYRNKNNLTKVHMEAYRVTQYLSKLKSSKFKERTNLNEAIEDAENYIAKLQNSDGSWYDVSNKQGLSNVWATGFIASHLNPKKYYFKNAVDFLLKNRQNGLWGYNTDWIADFDSTTCVILTLLAAGFNVNSDLRKWFKGQKKRGGFSTYSEDNEELLALLGLKDFKQVKGWTEEHVCVSALAYYLISNSKIRLRYKDKLALLRNYILKNKNIDGVWESYWWTSKIYSTCFVIKGMINENNSDQQPIINNAIRFLIRKQNKDGSFSCDVLKQKSVFYTSLVLGTICSDRLIYLKYQKSVARMKAFILKNQFDDGGFQGSNFLVIPQSGVEMKKKSDQNFKLNATGGSNVITGEVSNLFSTSVALNALGALNKVESIV